MTDHYAAVELAVRTLVKAELSSYFPSATADNQVTKSDDTTYDFGYDYWFTTYPGAFPTEPIGSRVVQVNWEVIIDLLSRWNGSEAASWEQFITYRSDVFNLFNLTNKGRNLDRTDGVKSSFLSSEDRPRYIPLRAEDPDSPASHIGQVCVLTVAYVVNKV